jgi:hypothetical protein
VASGRCRYSTDCVYSCSLVVLGTWIDVTDSEQYAGVPQSGSAYGCGKMHTPEPKNASPEHVFRNGATSNVSFPGFKLHDSRIVWKVYEAVSVDILRGRTTQ